MLIVAWEMGNRKGVRFNDSQFALEAGCLPSALSVPSVALSAAEPAGAVQ